ncbi:exported hypothetical protein [[Clostridium] ultunense Esp]|nr:exported hypothetical protein [[Clostridium] ultunense Esp]
MKWFTWKKGTLFLSLTALLFAFTLTQLPLAKADDHEGDEHEGYERDGYEHDEWYGKDGNEGYDYGGVWNSNDNTGAGSGMQLPPTNSTTTTLSWKSWNRDVTDLTPAKYEALPILEPKKITVQVDGREQKGIWAHPSNGELLLPINQILPDLPIQVEWYGKEKFLVLRGAGEILLLKVDRKVAYENGVKVALPQAPQMIQQDLYLPVSLLATAFQMNVTWDEANQKLVFTTNGNGGAK